MSKQLKVVIFPFFLDNRIKNYQLNFQVKKHQSVLNWTFVKWL